MRRVLVACACVGAFFCASGSASAATCNYDSVTRTVTDQLAANDTDVLYVSTTGTIESSATGTCGAATVKNTDRIVVTGDPFGAENFGISEQNGPFAREKGPRKSRGEISISVDLGGSDPNAFSGDALTIDGTPGNDTISIGADGVALNTNGTLDVAIAGDPELTVDGQLGNDTISGQGGYGAGAPYGSANELRLFGASERGQTGLGETNTITGRDGRDYIAGGGTGLQTLTGLGGDDALFANGSLFAGGPAKIDGGGGNDSISGDDYADTLTGGAGDDIMHGQGGNDTIDGGDGNDMLNGETGSDAINAGPGDDYITADDHEPDTVDGGDGNDWAYYDASYDTVTNVEQLFPQY